MTDTLPLAGAFLAPIAAVLLAQWAGMFSGWKTRSSVFVAIVAQLGGAVDLSFLPADIATALTSGCALAAWLGYELKGKAPVEPGNGYADPEAGQ